MQHLPYLLDLVLCDFFIFLHLKDKIQRWRFSVRRIFKKIQCQTVLSKDDLNSIYLTEINMLNAIFSHHHFHWRCIFAMSKSLHIAFIKSSSAVTTHFFTAAMTASLSARCQCYLSFYSVAITVIPYYSDGHAIAQFLETSSSFCGLTAVHSCQNHGQSCTSLSNTAEMHYSLPLCINV